MFATFTMVTLFGSLGRLVLSPLLPTIIADLEISRAAAGVGLTVLWAFTAVAQFPGGRLSDGLSRKTMLLVGLGANVVGFTMLALSSGYTQLVVSLAVVGIGTGLFIPAKYLVLTELFVERRGRAFGVNSAAAEIGGVLASVAAVLVLAVGAWRVTFLPVAGILLLGILAFSVWSDERVTLARTSLDVRGTARRLFGNRDLLVLLLTFSLFSFVWQGVTGFLPDFLHVHKEFSQTFASNAFAALFVVAAVVTPVVGSLGDRLGHARVGILTPLVGSVGLGVILLAGDRVGVLVGIAVLAAGIGSFWPLLYAHLMDALPDSDMGGDFGATRTVFMGLGSFGPAYVGVVVDAAGYVPAFVGFVGCLLVTTALLVFIVRSS
jgi:MFS family permease